MDEKIERLKSTPAEDPTPSPPHFNVESLETYARMGAEASRDPKGHPNIEPGGRGGAIPWRIHRNQGGAEENIIVATHCKSFFFWARRA